MRFFLDENFPKSAAAYLIGRGHEVLDLRGTGEEGMEDGILFTKVQEARAVFLTTDRDFFHTIPHLYASHLSGGFQPHVSFAAHRGGAPTYAGASNPAKVWSLH